MSALASLPRRLIVAGAACLLACNAILDNESAILDDDAPEESASPTEPSEEPAASEESDARDETIVASGKCASAKKLCGGTCVATTDPLVGCGAATCKPCELPHALPGCAAGKCSVGSCEPGWGNCNGRPEDGCEANLASPATCGQCNVRCPATKNGTTTCVAGRCVPACTDGFGDCDEKPGCETQLSKDKKNCGACGVQCFFGKCENGRCTL